MIGGMETSTSLLAFCLGGIHFLLPCVHKEKMSLMSPASAPGHMQSRLAVLIDRGPGNNKREADRERLGHTRNRDRSDFERLSFMSMSTGEKQVAVWIEGPLCSLSWIHTVACTPSKEMMNPLLRNRCEVMRPRSKATKTLRSST